MSWVDLLFGRPLASSEDKKEKVGAAAGVPIFGLDALGSAAYGPEAALAILMVLGAAGAHYILPITAAVILLLGIVYFSYRQTIEAYPSGGGAYTVASQNLGEWPGLLAAAALMVDYILVAAVGIAAGVGALVSALPFLQPHTLSLCLAILVCITLINLRGVRDSGLVFMVPTYLFVGCLLLVIGMGVVKAISSGGHPIPLEAPRIPIATIGAASAWLLLKAFSSGCTAMTGVEAVSNGVTTFRDPREKEAKRALTIIIGILVVLLAGIAYLCRAYGIVATDPASGHYESVLSQLVGCVAGKRAFYYVCIASIVLVLSLQANTAFAGFPNLCRSVAVDKFLPASFTRKGRRLVYSQGILVLAILAGGLLVLFGGVTDRLIPLFAIGAFLAFTLSQAGMVAHWRRTGGRHAWHHIFLNGLGAVATGITVLIVAISKFAEGAWVTVLVVPLLLVLMKKVRRHYEWVDREIVQRTPLHVEQLKPPLVVVPVGHWTRIAQKTLRFALTLSPDIVALHIDCGEHSDLRERWQDFVEEPTMEAGLPTPRLVTVKSPYRFIITPILRYVLELERTLPKRHIAVIVPEIVERRWYQYFLHQQRGRLLSLLLVFKGSQRISVVSVPWHLDAVALSNEEDSIVKHRAEISEEKAA